MSKGWDDLSEVEITKSLPKSLLIVDGNNIAHRYIGRANYADYQEDYVKTVESLGRSYNAINTIVCFDFGKSYYRAGLLDSYKANREEIKEQLDEEQKEKKNQFYQCLNDVPNYLTCPYIKIRGVEADDLISYLVNKHKDNYDHIWIISSDKDMYQLLSEKVSIFNLFSRKEITLDSYTEMYDIEPKDFIFVRVLEGEKSDNILGVEGIGIKRALGLVKKYKTLDNLIKELPIKGKAKYIENLNNSKEKLILNESLIALNNYNQQALESSIEGDNVWNILKDF